MRNINILQNILLIIEHYTLKLKIKYSWKILLYIIKNNCQNHSNFNLSILTYITFKFEQYFEFPI